PDCNAVAGSARTSRTPRACASRRLNARGELRMDPLLLDGLFSYLHFIFIFLMVGALVAELFVLRLAASAPVLKLLARIDIMFGASAGFVLLAGFGRVYLGAKGADYYWANHSFWGKLTVFVIIGLITIWPTVKFIQWGSALKKDASFLPP